MDLKFEWDRDKAASNLKKHKVSFEEASTVFDDPFAVIFDDEDHSLEEHREIIIGHSIKRRLLLVFFTEVAENNVVRIFSARKAIRKERKDYEENVYF
ncbi:MAG: BrnT family toxin [Anaerolineae bacterium]